MNFDDLVWRAPPTGPGWESIPPEAVIWTDVARFDRSWRATQDYIGLNGVGSKQYGRYERVGVFLKAMIGKTRIYVPHVSIENGTVIFTDGRHRFAWMRDRGLTALPIEVSDEAAREFRVRFESIERIGRFEASDYQD
ncbi:hypothetical protein [Burkholderia gladioli]|uniref:hypothetical protein n=1 Tax=Burkholderia gladioli TaxID=28095 RepID=UPI00163F846D|nr:hypothetical protein [Burkholderia gladioli]